MAYRLPTAHATPAVTDRRHEPGLAVISVRGVRIKEQLGAAGMKARLLLPQLDGMAILPTFRPPLLVDTVEMGAPILVRILHDLALHAPDDLVLAIVNPDDFQSCRLLASRTAMLVIIAETDAFTLLQPWLRLRPAIPASVWIGLSPLPPPHPRTIAVLASLMGTRTVSDAARRAGVTRRAFRRWCAAVRVACGLPSGQQAHYPPALLAEAICLALSDGAHR